MANEATDIKFILKDPERLAYIMEQAAQSADRLDRNTSKAGQSTERLRSAGERLNQANDRVRQARESPFGQNNTDYIKNLRAAELAQQRFDRIQQQIRSSKYRVSGPYQQLQDARNRLQAGMGAGLSPQSDEFKDLLLNLNNRQSRIDKLENPARKPGFIHSTLSRMSRVPMDLSSAASAGLSAVGAAGPEGKAIEIIGNAAMEAAGKIKEMADSAAASGRQMTELRVATGATNGEAAMLTGLGANSGDATGVRNRALGNPYAYAQAQQAGVSFMPGPMGEATSGRDLIRLLEGIRKQSEAQQRISLRTLGLEGFAGLMKVSDRTFEQIRSDSRLTAQLMGDAFQRSSAEYDAASKRFEGARERSAATAGKSFMDDITNLKNTGADVLDSDSKWAASHPQLAKLRTDTSELLFSPLGYLVTRAAEVYQNNKGGAVGSQKPEDKIAGATDRLSMAIARLSAGNVGNGEGFDSAIPGALRSGQNLAVAAAHGELAAMSLH